MMMMMQRSIVRSSARLIQQQGSRRLISSNRSVSLRNHRSKWIAAGLTTLGTATFLMMSNPVLADAKKDSKVAKAVKSDAAAEETPSKLTEQKQSETPASEEVEEGEAEEEDQGQQGAYDPVTGKINWDCPCLGGMAHGPCGEEFKEAFACFVYSELEPKGIDCVEKFKNMQNCFRQYPEVYSEELRDDEDAESGDISPSPLSGEEEVVVQIVEDDAGNVLTDEVTINNVSEDVVAIDEKISLDLKDVDEFVRDEPNQN